MLGIIAINENHVDHLEDDPQMILVTARCFRKTGDFIKALQKYMKYFLQVPPEQRSRRSESEFITFLGDIIIFFSDEDSITELAKCLGYATNWFPENIELHNTFGSFLIKVGDISNGLQYILNAYRMAVERGEPRLEIENNMLHIVWDLMPRWHFRMLNGKLRNESFKKAIHKAIDKGLNQVVDIGSGCGLLSLYAGIHHSHPSVIAFEENSILQKKAVALMAKYCKEIKYNCYNEYSYLVKEIEEPRRNLLITEIFDVGFFGEGILNTLNHAFRVIMKEKEFTVIPSGVTMYVTGIHCEALDKKFRLFNKIPLLKDIEVCLTQLITENPYDADKFSLEKYEIMTETHDFFHMDLNCKITVESLLKELWVHNFQLKVIKSGTIDCFVVWFDLHLDEEIVISTNPFHINYESCWEQAIFHCKHPLEVEENELLDLRACILEKKLQFKNFKPVKCNLDSCLEISKSAIQFLNDKKWVDYITILTKGILSPVKKQLMIADFCAFPLAGLIAAKKGHSVLFVFREQSVINFIIYIMTKLAISYDLVSFCQYGCYPNAILNWSHLDFIVYEPVCQDGSLNPSPMGFNSLFQHRQFNYFFDSVIVHFAFIDSPYLDYCNRVNKDNVEPFDELVTEMNEYSGCQHPSLPNNFPYELMSSEAEWTLKEQHFSVQMLTGLKDGTVNGILTWFTLVGRTGVLFRTKESTNFKKNVFIFPEKKIKHGENVQILCKYKPSGLLQIEICGQLFLQSDFHRLPTNPYFNQFFVKNFQTEK